MKRLLHIFLLTAVFAAMLVAPAHALEYTIDEPEDYLFGRPTSEDAPYTAENPNVDRSKNTALIPPGFGTPTSYLPNSGEYLTPNLVPGALSGGLVNQAGSVGGGTVTNSGYPAVDVSGGTSQFSYTTTQTTAFTEVTSDLYYSGGHLGTLKIPSLGVNVKIYEGTDSTQLAKGAGHFTNTSIWNGNVSLAAHNRGANSYFGEIHTLESGDRITLTTKEGTRTYSVTSVSKISETDNSMLESTSDNCITLFTCVRDQREYRWCVRAVET